MNTCQCNIMTVWGTKQYCYNQILKFQGTFEEAEKFAKKNGYTDVVLTGHMNICPTCKGKKKVEVTIVTVGSGKPSEKMMMNCHVCEGAGEISDQKLIAIREEKKLWCRCKNPTFGSYPQDGECSCGMHKHHVHCGTCGKISQIG